MIKLNDITIGISGSDLDDFKEQQMNDFQEKRITWQGEENILVTTVLQRLYEFAAGKVQIILADTMPSSTEPNAQYWVKTYSGTTLEDGRFVIMTDTLNNATFIGKSSADLTEFYTKEEIDTKLTDLATSNFRDGVVLTTLGNSDNAKTLVSGQAARVALGNKQDKIIASDQLTTPTDSDKLSYINNVTNNRWTFANIWTWIKGKITSTFYPVGSVILNMGTNPSANFGGTWQLLATGTKALYLDSTAGTTVNEELPDPSITIGSNGKKTVDFKGAKGFAYKQGGQSGKWGIDYGTHELYEQASFDSVETASNHSHTITVGNSTYKSGGKVRAAGITICAWKRTA